MLFSVLYVSNWKEENQEFEFSVGLFPFFFTICIAKVSSR